MAQTYKQLLNKAISKGMVQDAQTWFDTTYRDMSSKSTIDIISRGDDRLTKNLAIGKMYLFHYDPKHKETLPLYDRFPLIFPFESLKDGFLGLNFHYLPYMQRAALLDNLMSLSSNKTFSDQMRINLNYRLLKGMSKLKSSSEGIKRYLNSHIKSRFFYIKPEEWQKAILLPLDQFVYNRK